MYKAPILERYGTFRELTKGGGGTPGDGFDPEGEFDCVDNGDGTFTCDTTS